MRNPLNLARAADELRHLDIRELFRHCFELAGRSGDKALHEAARAVLDDKLRGTPEDELKRVRGQVDDERQKTPSRLRRMLLEKTLERLDGALAVRALVRKAAGG